MIELFRIATNEGYRVLAVAETTTRGVFIHAIEPTEHEAIDLLLAKAATHDAIHAQADRDMRQDIDLH